MIIYKIDILKALREAGYNTSKIRQERIIAERSLQALREGRAISFDTLDKICKILDKQPGDLIRFEDDDE